MARQSLALTLHRQGKTCDVKPAPSSNSLGLSTLVILICTNTHHQVIPHYTRASCTF